MGLGVTAFNRDVGQTQLRIRPIGTEPMEQNYVMCLGSDTPGRYEKIKNADNLIARAVAAPNCRVVRVRARTRPPASQSSGNGLWALQVTANGALMAVYAVDLFRENEFFDIAFNAKNSAVNMTLDLRLRYFGASVEENYIELPAIYYDGLILDTNSTTPILINRYPEPGLNHVSVYSGIIFHIEDTTTGGAGINVSSIRAYLDGALILTGNTPAVGWSGSTVDLSSTGGQIVEMYSDTELLSSHTYTMRVTAEIAGNPALSVDTSWTFTTEDLTAPAIVSATATGPKTVHVVFSEPVKQVNASLSNDALNPANYTFARLIAPAVDVEAASVSTIGSSEVEITTDISLTPGAPYTLTATDAEDLIGNEFAAPTNVTTFLAFEPPKPALRTFDLYRLLPLMNRQEDLTQHLAKFISCLQEVIDLTLYDIDRFPQIFDADLAPEGWLDMMLYDMGNPFPFELDETDKRRLLRVLVTMYQQKGAGVGIVNVVRFFMGLEVEIETYAGDGETLVLGESELGFDWTLGTDNAGQLYSFRVIAGQILTETQRSQISQIAEYMKPAHTHFLGIVEPEEPIVVDHLELGLSELGENWELH